MTRGKSKSSQKTREPYGKVTEVGQVPVALREIKELTNTSEYALSVISSIRRLQMIDSLVDSVISVTCANPGCLSEMASIQ